MYITMAILYIKSVLEEKDPRVIISSNLSWDSHVMHIVLKTNRMLGLLKRTCPLITDVKVRRTLYLSLVKSQLSYAIDVWSPGSVKLRTILERVQRRATRWILRTKSGEVSYSSMLRHGGGLICIQSYNDHNFVKIYQNLPKFGNLGKIGNLNFPER